MRKILFATAAAALVGSPAFAADVYQPPVSAAPAPVYTGTGYGWGKFENNSRDIDTDGFLGGITGGMNWQVGSFVLGAEADWSLAGIDGSRVTPAVGGPTTVEKNWVSTVRGRAGYAFDRYLIYGTAGFAFGDISVKGGGQKDDDIVSGWAAGLGVEGMLTPSLTAKAEYLYTDLGDEAFGVGAPPIKGSLHDHAIRFGVNYKFDLF